MLLVTGLFTSRVGAVHSIAVSMSVCLSLRSSISKTRCQNFT